VAAQGSTEAGEIGIQAEGCPQAATEARRKEHTRMSEISVAIIDHKFGTNFYAAETEDGIYAELAEFCREWWGDTGLDTPPPENDTDCVQAYFEAVQDEHYVVNTTEIRKGE
jgi:hypothetical protein